MAKLEGIIYNAFNGYIVLRGFAPIGEIASISRPPKAYQRDVTEQHQIDIVKYIDDNKAYFPEVTLAYQVDDYAGLITSIAGSRIVEKEDGAFVKGLHILSGYIPIYGNRAHQAYLELKNPDEEEKLSRVDGNHRLSPFSERIEWWYRFINIPEDVEHEPDEKKKENWIKNQAKIFKDNLSKRIIPYTVVLSDKKEANKFEALIFHDINFKALPLKQEASLKIISDLGIFEDEEKLGNEYPLALELIKKVRIGIYDSIYWLNTKRDEKKTFYRTSCLRIIQLLLNQKRITEEELIANKKKIEGYRKVFVFKGQKRRLLRKRIKEEKKEIQEVERNYPHFRTLTEYKELCVIKETLENDYKITKNEFDILLQRYRHLIARNKTLKQYIENCEDVNKITDALNGLVPYYQTLDKDKYGNIAFLCALVYYSLFEQVQLQSFISWASRNGINQITNPDDLSKDSSQNLITMFDQISQSMENEIFVSMQFGDSQSELIYEKIVRAIEKFNAKHKNRNLWATPIRIDRAIDPSTSSIPDKILKAIKSCGLIIADLSSANINVYHEIGYAMGVAQAQNMKPNIILLYKEDTDYNKENKKDVDKFVGFNLRNLAQLRFKDYDQLVNGLVERLEKHYGLN